MSFASRSYRSQISLNLDSRLGIDQSTKIQNRTFGAWKKAQQVLKLAREADHKAAKAWKHVMNLDNRNANFHVLQNANGQGYRTQGQHRRSVLVDTTSGLRQRWQYDLMGYSASFSTYRWSSMAKKKKTYWRDLIRMINLRIKARFVLIRQKA